MRWEDHPADLQLKECWLVAPGREPVLLVQGGEARGAGVAVLEGPPTGRGRKVWRFRFTYAVPEGGRVPFSATLKCKAGLQVSMSTLPHHDATTLVPTISGGSFVPNLWAPLPGWEQHPQSPKSLGAPSPVPHWGCGRGQGFLPPLMPTSTSAEQHHL